MGALFEITEDPISIDEVAARLADPTIGAVVTFVGVVRGVTAGRTTLRLEYEAYPEMALVTMRQIADEVRERWGDVRGVAIVHRVGSLAVGEAAVVIALATAHRAQAFDALHYAIDRVKEISPIWKKEIWAEGSEWRSEQ
jgi:molybdopterin synthase catalytic subunit